MLVWKMVVCYQVNASNPCYWKMVVCYQVNACLTHASVENGSLLSSKCV